MALWRRRVVARVATEVSTSLRRQIHRQMYRLGQSSLPTEGIGPVINLWTREVNDIRDGLIADLDLTPRIQVLAAGLLVIALLVSPLLTIFPGVAGSLRLADRAGLEPRRSTGDRGGAARRFGAALSAPRRSGPAADRPDLWRERYDRQRFDEHLERYRRSGQRGGSSPAPINPSTGLLYGAALTIALGLLGYNVVVNDQISIATMLILLVSLAGLAYPDLGMAAD